MFGAVNHTDRIIVVSFKGTSNLTIDLAHDVASVLAGVAVRVAGAKIASALNIPHRFNSCF